MKIGIYFVGVCGAGKTSARKAMGQGIPTEKAIPIAFQHKKKGACAGSAKFTIYDNMATLGSHNNGSDGSGTVEELSAATKLALNERDVLIVDRKVGHLNPRIWQAFWDAGGDAIILVHMNLSDSERRRRLLSRNPSATPHALEMLNPAHEERRVLRQMLEGSRARNKTILAIEARDDDNTAAIVELIRRAMDSLRSSPEVRSSDVNI